MELDQITDNALRLTQLFMTNIEEMMGTKGDKISKMSMNEKQLVTGLLSKLMRAATGLVKEARALQKDAQTAARKLSHEQRREMIKEFISMMPIEHRNALRTELGWDL